MDKDKLDLFIIRYYIPVLFVAVGFLFIKTIGELIIGIGLFSFGILSVIRTIDIHILKFQL